MIKWKDMKTEGSEDMYTILMRNDKSLIATNRTTIYQREKLVDKLEFLIPYQYADLDIRDCMIVLKYVDQGNIAQSESLTKDDDLYKDNYVRCVLPVNTKITKFAGNLTLRLTFIKVNENSESDVVMHSGETTLTVNPLKDMYAHVTDESLEILDKQMIEMKAMLDAANALNEAIDKEKADDLSYENNTLQLVSNGVKIGTPKVLDQANEFDIVEFGEADPSPDEPSQNDDNTIVEF